MVCLYLNTEEPVLKDHPISVKSMVIPTRRQVVFGYGFSYIAMYYVVPSVKDMWSTKTSDLHVLWQWSIKTDFPVFSCKVSIYIFLQFFEVPFDSQMNRTKNRPLVRGVIR